MTTSNIERFDECAGRILAALYASFPTPRELFPASFIEGGRDVVSDPTGFVELTADASFFMDTVAWLKSAGYISGSYKPLGSTECGSATDYLWATYNSFGFTDCVLTEKGIAILNAVPDASSNPETFGERLGHAAKQSSVEILSTVMREVIAYYVKSKMGGPS